MKPDFETPIDLPGGLAILPLQDMAIDQLLDELVKKCPAQFVLLTEVSGQILSMHGERGTTDLAALSSLVAGDLAASQEIARLMHQYQNYQLILREGPQTNTFICEAGPHLVLFVQVDKDVPVGWARLLIRETSRQLAEIVSTHPKELENLDIGLSEEKISALVDGGLESIWNG